MGIPVRSLGQSGFRFQFDQTVVYSDPYLTDYVAEVEGDDLHRLLPSPAQPNEVNDADWLLISHIHLDHCDPTTLLPLSQASSLCKFICPDAVKKYLVNLGIPEARIISAREEWIILQANLKVRPVPAAHPLIERSQEGLLHYVGYVMEYCQRRIYYAGDTSPNREILHTLKKLQPIDVAILPVNERNFYREQRGIIGNMSVREAFQMAVDLNVKTMVPMHWDMFALNSVFPEEIELLYKLINPPFQMIMKPEKL